MFSQTVEDALRNVFQLTPAAPNFCTTEEVVTSTKAPIAYVSKVLQGLAKFGVVRWGLSTHGVKTAPFATWARQHSEGGRRGF